MLDALLNSNDSSVLICQFSRIVGPLKTFIGTFSYHKFFKSWTISLFGAQFYWIFILYHEISREQVIACDYAVRLSIFHLIKKTQFYKFETKLLLKSENYRTTQYLVEGWSILQLV